MKQISLITRFSWAGISTSVLNTAFWWEMKGYNVIIIAVDADSIKFPFPDFTGNKIKIYALKIDGRYAEAQIILNCGHLLVNSEWIIVFDVDALLLLQYIGFLLYKRIIYHSLEFFEPEANSTSDLIKKKREKYLVTRVKTVFTQDNLRAKYIVKEFGISNIQIVYNSPAGNVITEKNDYFRKKFNISTNRKIVLCIGSLIAQHYLLELLNSLYSWSDDFVLVLHGWFPDPIVRGVAEGLLVKYPGRLYISTEIFDNYNKYIPYQSSDIVFAGFIADNNNLKYAAGSAGKIFDSMKAGKPIIGYDTPGMRGLIEDNHIGYVFSHPKEINNMLAGIIENYSVMSAASHAAFHKYEFNTQYEKIISTIIKNNF